MPQHYKAQEDFLSMAKSYKCTQSSKVTECTVMKLPRDGKCMAKKIYKIQFSFQKLSSATKGMEALDDFYTDHPFLD